MKEVFLEDFTLACYTKTPFRNAAASCWKQRTVVRADASCLEMYAILHVWGRLLIDV